MSTTLRIWDSDAYQACQVGQFCADGKPFPEGLKVGECTEMPVLVPDMKESIEAYLCSMPTLSMDSANANLKLYNFRKRAVRHKTSSSWQYLWERVS